MLAPESPSSCWSDTVDGPAAHGQFFLLLLLILVAWGGGGCATTDFTKPVASFSKSVNQSGTLIASYYAELNSSEREYYLDGQLYASQKVETADGATPTPLLYPVFAPESVRARLDALKLINAYAARLSALAGTTAPSDFQKNASTLGENFGNLQGTFEKLGHDAAANKIKDLSANSYAGPISTIVGIVGAKIIEQERDRMLKSAIDKGAPAVNTVLDLLRADLSNTIQVAEETGLHQELADRVKRYNDTIDKSPLAPFDERKLQIADISTAAARYEAAVDADPAALIDSMRQAHAQLVSYADSNHQPRDLASLTASLQVFADTVQNVATQIQKIGDSEKGP